MTDRQDGAPAGVTVVRRYGADPDRAARALVLLALGPIRHAHDAAPATDNEKAAAPGKSTAA